MLQSHSSLTPSPSLDIFGSRAPNGALSTSAAEVALVIRVGCCLFFCVAVRSDGEVSEPERKQKSRLPESDSRVDLG